MTEFLPKIGTCATLRRRIAQVVGWLAILLCLFVGYERCEADGEDFDVSPDNTVPARLSEPAELSGGWTKERKLFWANAATTVGTLMYGFGFWDYGEHQYQFVDEGWFTGDTAYGGADKLGHAFSAYLASDIFSSLYSDWGYDDHESTLYGALSSFSMFTLIEVGDGASKHGFSGEDLVMDGLGVLFSYARQKSPALERLVDYRVEYWPSDAVLKGGKNDFATDYSGFKYLLALKFSGFHACENNPLQYLELHCGYYTRGYVNQDADYFSDTERVPYVGFGVNMSRICDQSGFHKTSSVLHYYQIPYTYFEMGSDLND